MNTVTEETVRDYDTKYLIDTPIPWITCVCLNIIIIWLAYTSYYQDDKSILAHPHIWNVDEDFCSKLPHENDKIFNDSDMGGCGKIINLWITNLRNKHVVWGAFCRDEIQT
eukprot:UN20247